MKKGIGIICLVAGVILLAWGYQSANSLKGKVHRVFSSSTKNRITWLYIGGAVLCTMGVFQIYGAKK